MTHLCILQINGSQKLSGGQPPEVFLRAFQAATSWLSAPQSSWLHCLLLLSYFGNKKLVSCWCCIVLVV